MAGEYSTKVTLLTKDHLVITAVGPDRVGLVEQITQFLLREGCNIEDSKMAVFCGEFAIILLVSGEAAGLDRVAQSLPLLTSQTGLAFTRANYDLGYLFDQRPACFASRTATPVSQIRGLAEVGDYARPSTQRA